jgi:hypothetical protein
VEADLRVVAELGDQRGDPRLRVGLVDSGVRDVASRAHELERILN